MSEILEDGYQTLISFALNANLKLKEISVKPPGIDTGGSVDQTTMRNEEVRTKSAKKLKDYTDGSVSVAYDPAIYDEMDAMAGKNQLITIEFPDGSSLAFWGYVDKFEPAELSEGERPTAELTIVTTNKNDSGAETKPVYTAAA